MDKSSKGILIKSVLSMLILVVIGAIVYMYFNAFILDKSYLDNNEIAEERLEDDKRTAEIVAPPREDIQLTDDRKTEIQGDLRTNQEVPTPSSNDEVRSQLVN